MITRIRCLRVGQMRVPGPEVLAMDRFEETLPLTLWMVILEGGGETILINTGARADDGGLLPDLRNRPRDGVLAALEDHGVKPGLVTRVIVTPLQAYAIGNLDQFPNARLYLSRRGWIDFHAPEWPVTRSDRGRAIPPPILERLESDLWERLILTRDEDVVAPGVRVSWAGCHHRSSLVVWAKTPGGRYAFTDTVFYGANLLRDQPPGVAEDRAECLRMYARLRKQAEHVVGLYDPAVSERYPDGIIL